MIWAVYIGVLLAILGLAGLGLCIAKAAKLRKSTDKDAVRAGLNGLVALNMASVGLASLGLALVVVGLLL